MAQFAVADVPGQFQRGAQFEQQRQQSQFDLSQRQKLAPLKVQAAELDIQSVQQANEQKNDLAVLRRNVQTAVELKNTPDNQKASFLANKIAQGEASGRSMAESKKALDLVNAGQFQELATGTDRLIQVGQQLEVSRPESLAREELTLRQETQKSRDTAATERLSSVQQKVAAEGIDPNTQAGFDRAREITQGSRTDPSLKPSDQALLNKANEGQLASAGFANRVGSANVNLDRLEAMPGFDPTSIAAAFFESVPGGNIALSTEQQEYQQAKRDFITAVLRKESGAAIGADEFVNEDKKFFPQIGDKPGVLKQKAAGRKRAFDNLKKQSKGVFDVQFKQTQELTSPGGIKFTVN